MNFNFCRGRFPAIKDTHIHIQREHRGRREGLSLKDTLRRTFAFKKVNGHSVVDTTSICISWFI